ncbi:hypothetical protein [Sphingomonas sp. R86521]|uniref:hypothetical protein n=1 Tax=Sphingomonas sp. R86521 TaxID=3093860 RepID=UPI0036D291C3
MNGRIAIQRSADEHVRTVEDGRYLVIDMLKFGADNELDVFEALAAFDNRADDVWPARRFAALALYLQARRVQ